MVDLKQPMKSVTILLEGVDGLYRDVDGAIGLSCDGLVAMMDIATPLLKAFREGQPLPAKFASLRELLASFGDEPLYVRQAGEFVPHATLCAGEIVLGKSIVSINIPSKRLISLVIAMRALDCDGYIRDIRRD